MKKDKLSRKLKIFQYRKKKEEYTLETRLFVNIQFGVIVLFIFTFLAESYFNHYPEAKIVWIVGIILPVLSIELVLREKLARYVCFMTIVLYTFLTFIGIHFSGSILTPSVLFSFLGILILSVIAEGALKYISIATIIFSVIYHTLVEMRAENISYIYQEIYIDWVVYFTIIALIVVWIISKIILILRKYDETIKKANDDLYYSSITDPLTKVFNRNYLNECAENLLNNKRARTPLTAILMVDIDYFKEYNDCYGHLAGDKCLQTVASVLKRSLHRSDDMVFRIGGEEFLILLDGIEKEFLGEISDRVHGELAKEKINHKNSAVSPFVTVSIGAASFDVNDIGGPEEIFKVVDTALYKAKEKGRNRTEEVSLS